MKWKKIENYEDYYMVSEKGDVKRIKYNDAGNSKKHGDSKILKKRKDIKDSYGNTKQIKCLTTNL